MFASDAGNGESATGLAGGVARAARPEDGKK
jgi:hypothetical protein